MPDKVEQEKRSKIMASVRSEGNKSTELVLKEILNNEGLTGWRENARDLPGKPDFVFDKEKVAIFVDGCFWHGCPKCYRRPSSSQEYWDEKVRNNMRRDKRVRSKLRRQGWSVLRFWEHSLIDSDKVIRRIKAKLSERREMISKEKP